MISCLLFLFLTTTRPYHLKSRPRYPLHSQETLRVYKMRTPKEIRRYFESLKPIWSR